MPIVEAILEREMLILFCLLLFELTDGILGSAGIPHHSHPLRRALASAAT
jgi:hypothetical protein